MTADKQLKAYIDRVLRLKEEQDALGDDIREIYAEAKAEGYDKTVMGKVVAHLRRELKKGAGAVAEAESIFDTYLLAYQRASGMPVATHTHEEEFDPITGEFVDGSKLVATVATGMQAEIGLKALGAAVDIMIAREEAEETQANPEETGGHGDTESVPVVDAGSRTVVGRSATATSERMDVTGGESAASNPEKNTASDVATGRHSLGSVSPLAETAATGSADANAGGDHVTAQAQSAAKAGALVKPAPAPKPIRPYCRNPGELCGGYGSTHCASCLKAARAPEVAA